MRYTEGATWYDLIQYHQIYITSFIHRTAIVGALVTPIGGMFWLLFSLDPDTNVFKWSPSWVSSNWYVIAGLLFMGPFIYLYDMETNKIETQIKEKTLAFKGVYNDDFNNNDIQS